MKKLRIAINGFGRIGRVFFRQAFDYGGIDIVAVNDLGDVENLAYLLKYDTVYGKYERQVGSDKKQGKLVVDGKEIQFLQEKDPAKLPWKESEIDVVIESTGFFEDYEKASAHVTAGAKRVIISAPGKGKEGEAGVTVLMGLNEDRMVGCAVTSNASCTTNAASPVAAVMMANPGVKKAMLSTVHAYTATQKIVDSPDAKDWRRGRAGAQNIVPSTTGAAISVGKALPELDGKFDGIAIRVPVSTGSLVDFTFVASRRTSVEEINDIFRKAAAEPRWKGILALTDEQLVSSDIIGNPHGSIVDTSFTKVIDGDLVKVLAWYDNEWGYAATLLQHVIKAGKLL
ncbi:MAG: type I glyceraldehyde-3-phosphate dehydrogenase [bacterium]|nr:type I glyceraldehyde-3-phosphate dehydrogenase [bacterium]